VTLLVALLIGVSRREPGTGKRVVRCAWD